ncbi:hypothetical protein SynNOUM97013_01053 [Synechococcus sp. NOUM97013]|nr:hypothetical protein SynNOUM97013_01053 [Synechococcus sp. NOUM97013]
MAWNDDQQKPGDARCIEICLMACRDDGSQIRSIQRSFVTT